MRQWRQGRCLAATALLVGLAATAAGGAWQAHLARFFRGQEPCASRAEHPRHSRPAAGNALARPGGPVNFAAGSAEVVQGSSPNREDLQLCQFYAPLPRVLQGVDGQSPATRQGEPAWSDSRPLLWQEYGQGEYVGPARSPHVPEYRLRVDDQLDFVYRFTHEEISEPYRLIVGDEIAVESFDKDDPNDPHAIRRGDISQGRGLMIQPDGTIVLPGIGRVPVAGKTIDEVRADLEQRYRKYFNEPVMTVTPLKTNTRFEDLRSAVAAPFAAGNQTRQATVTPEGTVQLVGIASVPAQGLTLDELQAEIKARYDELVGRGVEVTAILTRRAPRYVWVVGEVNQPGQYELTQPITVIQALALARGFIVGGNVREIIVFRRDDNWQLMATRVDVRGVFLGKTPRPSDNLWLRDNDVVVVPKGAILRADEFIDLVFTRGLYGIFPVTNGGTTLWGATRL